MKSSYFSVESQDKMKSANVPGFSKYLHTLHNIGFMSNQSRLEENLNYGLGNSKYSAITFIAGNWVD